MELIGYGEKGLKMIAANCPLISVIMPVYTGDDYFEFALASVLKQTWENFEIIVVDDGSSDPRQV
jgi:glycosyltransferase involved in cell wall biosynthesis